MVAYKDLYLKYKSKYLNSGGSQEDYSTHSMNAPDDVPAKKGQFVTQQSGGARLPPQPLVHPGINLPGQNFGPIITRDDISPAQLDYLDIAMIKVTDRNITSGKYLLDIGYEVQISEIRFKQFKNSTQTIKKTRDLINDTESCILDIFVFWEKMQKDAVGRGVDRQGRYIAIAPLQKRLLRSMIEKICALTGQFSGYLLEDDAYETDLFRNQCDILQRISVWLL